MQNNALKTDKIKSYQKHLLTSTDTTHILYLLSRQKGTMIWIKKRMFWWHLESHWRKEQDQNPIQWYGSPDPNPYQYVTDPEHCSEKTPTHEVHIYCTIPEVPQCMSPHWNWDIPPPLPPPLPQANVPLPPVPKGGQGCGSGSGSKNWNKFTAVKLFYIFWIENCNLLILRPP